MKKILSLFVLAFVALSTMAGELTVFEGSDQNQYIPFRADYFDYSPYYGEVIYPAAAITDLLGQDITSIKFYVANEGGNVMSGGELSLYLGTTDQADFSGWSISLIPAEDLTLVAATPMTHGDSEIVFNLSEPFTYNGGNLVLLVSVTVEGTMTDYGYFYGENNSVSGSAYGAYSVYAQSFYPMTTFAYAGEEPQTNDVTTLAQANALEDNAQFTFKGDAVVTVCKDGYVFLRDQSGFGQIAGFTGTLENGQVLNQGWNATKTSITDGWARYTDATDITATGVSNSALAAPIVLTGAVDESMLNAYVVIENQPKSFFPARSYTLPDGTTIAKTETLWSMNAPAASKPYNVYGIICKVNGTFMINPVDFQDYVEPQWELGDVNHDTLVDVDDVSIMIKVVLGQAVPVYYATEANMDGDAAGSVDVTDVTILINKILNKTVD